MSTRFDPDELRELEQRLTDGLEAIAPRPRRSAADRVRAEVAITTQRHGLRPWIALRLPQVAWTRMAAAALVVVAALAVGIGIGASGVLNAARSPQPSASFGATWRQVQLVPPETAATDLVSDGYAGPNRIVLVGQRAGPKEAGADSTPAAWYSDDGITWHDSKVNVSSTWLTVSGLGAVFPVGDRLYAIGGSQEPAPPAAPVFESTDGGATWNELPGVDAPVVFRRVTTGGPGLVAVSGYNATVWTSADGRSWTAHSSEGGTTGTSEGLHAVAAHGSDLLAVGQVWHQSNGEITGLVLTSPDGEHWTRQTPPQDFVPLDVTWAGGAWLMTGYSGPPDGSAPLASILRSTDGVTWSAVALPGLDETGPSSSMDAIAAGPDGIVAIGGGSPSVGPSFSAWTSPDGLVWELHALPEGSVGSAQAVTALVRSGQIIVAGNGWTASRDRLPAVWVSPASAPQPTPTASASSQLPAADIYQQWDRAELPQGVLRPRANPHDIVEFKGSLYVVGGAETGSCEGVGCIIEASAAVWQKTSAGWVRYPDLDSFGAGAMDSAAATASHLLVLGQTAHPPDTGKRLTWPELWISSDGQSFEAYDAPADFTAIVAAGNGYAEFLAAATTDDGSGPEIWSSLDGRTWERVADAATLGSGQIRTLRAVGASFVAVGSSEDQLGTSVIWVSQGGQLWTRLQPFGVEQIVDVTGTEARLVAVGLDGGVWVSGTAMETWTRATALDGHWLGSVRAARGGYVALSNPNEGPAEVWTSLSGERWDQVPAQASLPSSDFVGAMTVTAEGTAAFVGVHDPSGSKTASVWTSAPSQNGPTPVASGTPLPASPVFSAWSRIDLPDPAPEVYGGTLPRSILRFKDRWVAAGFVNGGCCDGGYSEETRGVIWTSTDGQRWQLVPPQPSLAEARISSVASNGSELVAVGVIDTPGDSGASDHLPATWYSTDGVTWQVVRNTPAFEAVTAAGSGFVAVAITDEQVQLYTSPDGHAWKWMASSSAAELPATTFGLSALAGRDDGTAVCLVSVLRGDGTTGEEVILLDLAKPAATFREVPLPGTVAQLTSLGSEWIATGTNLDSTELVSWESADGLDWSAATVERGDGLTVSAMVPAGGDLLVGGNEASDESGTMRLWIRTDGGWYRVSLPSGQGGEIAALGSDPNGTMVLAVGTSGRVSSTGPSTFGPSLWIASR